MQKKEKIFNLLGYPRRLQVQSHKSSREYSRERTRYNCVHVLCFY
jgi:hypothetical protein